MRYSEEILKRVKSFGALQYDLKRIVSILDPDDPDQFVFDFKDETSILHVYYMAGFNSGQYRIDAEQFKLAEIETHKAKVEFEDRNTYFTLRKTLFGV